MSGGMTMRDVSRVLDQYEALHLGSGMTIVKCGEWKIPEDSKAGKALKKHLKETQQ